MPDRPSLRVPLLVLALACASGCTLKLTHRCAVPDPVVEAAPGGGRIPLSMAVRYATPVPEVVLQKEPHHVWKVEPGAPTRALFDRLAASMFDRTTPAPAAGGAVAADGVAGADAALEIQVQRATFDWQPIGFAPYSAAVTYHATLRAPDGNEIAAFDVEGVGTRPALSVIVLATHCRGIGDAVALAMQDAGARFLERFAADPAVAAWFAGRGTPLPALAVRPPESYASPAPAATAREEVADPAMGGEPAPPPEAAPPPPARPVAFAGPVRPPVPRSMQLRVGLGTFSPEESAGRLERGRTGLSATVLGVEVRPRPALGVTLEYGLLGRGYSGATLPSPGGFAVRSGIFLDSMLFGLGLRAILPGNRVEPWVGATGQLVRTELSSSYSLFGLSGDGEPSGTAWSAGLDLAAGLAFYLPRHVTLGFEVRRLFARATFEPFPGSVAIGGVATSLTFGAAMP